MHEDEMSVVKTKLLWIVIFAAIAVTVLPLVILWVLFNLPDTVKIVATFCILIGWAIAAAYKEWSISKA